MLSNVYLFTHSLSIYTHAVEKGWVHNKKGEISFARGMFWGALGGVVGSYCASPFFLVSDYVNHTLEVSALADICQCLAQIR